MMKGDCFALKLNQLFLFDKKQTEMSMWADLLGMLLFVLVAEVDADCWLELVTKEGAGEACPPSTDCSSWAGCWTGSGLVTNSILFY